MSSQSRRQTVQFLLGAPAAARQIEDSGEWPSVLRLCVEWNTVPLFCRRVQEGSVRLPEACANWTGKLSMSAFVQTGLCLTSGLAALSVLQARAIPCAGFKGLASIAHLYSNRAESSLRSIRDVDILVHPDDARPAIQELLAHGYSLTAEASLDDCLDFVRQSPGSAGNEAISLANAKGASIDLHWKLGAIPVSTLLAEARTAVVMDRPAPVVSPRHSALLLAHHALRNNFVVEKTVHDILDFDTGLRRWPQEMNASELLVLADSFNLTAPLLALEEIVTAARGQAATWLSPAARDQDRQTASQLAKLCAHQMEYGALNTDLVYLADPATLLELGSAAVTGWTRFRTTMQQIDASHGTQETLGQRLKRLIGAASAFPVPRWGELRTLAAARRRMISARR